MKAHILVVDDEPGHRIMLEALLGKWGYTVTSAADGEESVRKVRERPFDAVLMDVRMAGMDGITALKGIQSYNPAVPVLIMTAYSTVESAVEALKSGARDYLLKPLDFDLLKKTLEGALNHAGLEDAAPGLENVAASPEDIIGKSQALRSMLELVHTVAPTESTVLITGKSGTGKELVAKALHMLSMRRDGPLVTVNCAALSENLLESELFGHEKGAFTGADKRREGRFFQAHKGSIFLDEIGEISPIMQVKLLRVIQQREIQRVGSDKTLTVDVRIIAATNRDLKEEVAVGRFREDLYYRLHVVNIRVPGLAEREGDIPLLAQHFIAKFAKKNHKELGGFTPQAMDMLLKHHWPGNVRELENAVEQAVVLAAGPFVTERELPPGLARPGEEAFQEALKEGTLEDMERDAIVQMLRGVADNKSEAAERLGISRKTLYAKMKRYGIEY